MNTLTFDEVGVEHGQTGRYPTLYQTMRDLSYDLVTYRATRDEVFALLRLFDIPAVRALRDALATGYVDGGSYRTCVAGIIVQGAQYDARNLSSVRTVDIEKRLADAGLMTEEPYDANPVDGCDCETCTEIRTNGVSYFYKSTPLLSDIEGDAHRMDMFVGASGSTTNALYVDWVDEYLATVA